MILSLVGSYRRHADAAKCLHVLYENGLRFMDLSMISKESIKAEVVVNAIQPGLGAVNQVGNCFIEENSYNGVSEQIEDMGVSNPIARRYEEEVRCGKTLLLLRGDMKVLSHARDVMIQNGADTVNFY